MTERQLLAVTVATFVLVFVASSQAINEDLGSLEDTYLSELRFKFRQLPKLTQCLQYWRALDEKLNPSRSVKEQDTKTLLDRAEAGLLRRISGQLKARKVTYPLVDYLEECARTIEAVRPVVSEISATTQSAQSELNALLESKQTWMVRNEELLAVIEDLRLAERDSEKALKELKLQLFNVSEELAAANKNLEQVSQGKAHCEQLVADVSKQLERANELKASELAKKDVEIEVCRKRASRLESDRVLLNEQLRKAKNWI